MPQLRTYSIFLSHSWDYHSEYETIISWLKGARLLNLADHSVSKFNPLPTKTKKQLYTELNTKIKRVHVVIIVAGMYFSYRDWMKVELEIAKNNNIPVIAIRPRGNQKIPKEIQLNAKEIVNWNSSSLITAIRKWAR